MRSCSGQLERATDSKRQSFVERNGYDSVAGTSATIRQCLGSRPLWLCLGGQSQKVLLCLCLLVPLLKCKLSLMYGRAAVCVLLLFSGRSVAMLVVLGYDGAAEDCDTLRLPSQLLTAVLLEAAVLTSGQLVVVKRAASAVSSAGKPKFNSRVETNFTTLGKMLVRGVVWPAFFFGRNFSVLVAVCDHTFLWAEDTHKFES